MVSVLEWAVTVSHLFMSFLELFIELSTCEGTALSTLL